MGKGTEMKKRDEFNIGRTVVRNGGESSCSSDLAKVSKPKQGVRRTLILLGIQIVISSIVFALLLSGCSDTVASPALESANTVTVFGVPLGTNAVNSWTWRDMEQSTLEVMGSYVFEDREMAKDRTYCGFSPRAVVIGTRYLPIGVLAFGEMIDGDKVNNRYEELISDFTKVLGEPYSIKDYDGMEESFSVVAIWQMTNPVTAFTSYLTIASPKRNAVNGHGKTCIAMMLSVDKTVSENVRMLDAWCLHECDVSSKLTGASIEELTAHLNKEGHDGLAVKNYLCAYRSFFRAACLDNAEAEYELAKMYRSGLGVKKHARQEYVWLKKSFERKFPKALYEMGLNYLSGNRVDKDLSKAIALFKEAAVAGNIDAKNKLEEVQKAIPHPSAGSKGTYLILNLKEPYNIEFLDSVPQGGWGDEYKTDKIVLRRIESGEFRAGSPEDESGRYEDEKVRVVNISESYYIGVFEITRAQWINVCGVLPRADVVYSNETNWQSEGDDWEAKPVIAGFGDVWSITSIIGHGHEDSPSKDSFFGKLRSMFPYITISLPNEDEWEYACRAGLASAYAVVDSAGNRVGFFGSARDVPRVGSYFANAWGLYDMNGSVAEWTSTKDKSGANIVRGKDRCAWRSKCYRGAYGAVYYGVRVKIKTISTN